MINEELRQKARESLEYKQKAWSFPRTTHGISYYLRDSKLTRQYHAKVIAPMIRQKHYVGLYHRSPSVALKLLGQEHYHAISAAQDKFLIGTWKRVIVVDNDVTREHMLHVSEADPMQVAYCPSKEYLLADRWIRTRLGRYLTKFFSDALTQDQIRELVQEHEQQCAPVTLQFIESDNPDGWEWVYEHSHGFTSCMVYNKPEGSRRHLHRALYGQDHPVRAYAYPGNGLRLAYIADRAYDPDHPDKSAQPGKVYARAIVRGNGYVRAYGDDRLVIALDAEGIDNSGELDGVRLAKRMYSGDMIVPYLDDCDYVIDRGAYLEVTNVFDLADYEADASGLAEWCGGRMICDYCGSNMHEDDAYGVGYHGDDETICGSCRERCYVTARGRNRQAYLVHESCVIWVGDVRYADDYLEDNGIVQCEHCDEHGHVDHMVTTAEGLVCELHCTNLDRPDLEGNDWALDDNVVRTEDGLDIHEACAAACCISDEIYHRDDLVQTANGLAHPDHIEEDEEDTVPVTTEQQPELTIAA